MLRITAPSQDVDALLAELRERVLEELDYRREADSQRLFAAYYDGHPTIAVPQIIGGLSTRRGVTSEPPGGVPFARLGGRSPAGRGPARGTLYRLAFRSPYARPAVPTGPHPANYPVQVG